MAVVLAVAWALPLAWWSVGATFAMLTVLIVLLVWSVRIPGWRMRLSETTTHAACCLWAIGAIVNAYAVRVLTGSAAGDQFTRLGYPFLVGTGLALPGGGLIVVLVVVVGVTPVVLFSRSAGLSAPRSRP